MPENTVTLSPELAENLQKLPKPNNSRLTNLLSFWQSGIGSSDWLKSNIPINLNQARLPKYWLRQKRPKSRGQFGILMKKLRKN